MIEECMDILKNVISWTIIWWIWRFAHSIYDWTSRQKLYKSFQSAMQHIWKVTKAFKQNSKRMFLNYMKKCKRILNPWVVKKVKEMMEEIHTEWWEYYMKEDKLSEWFRIKVTTNWQTYVWKKDNWKDYSNWWIWSCRMPEYLKINDEYIYTWYMNK